MELILIALATSVAMTWMICRLLPWWMIKRFNVYIDLAVTLIPTFLLSGSTAGATTAILAGLFTSCQLWFISKMIPNNERHKRPDRSGAVSAS